MTGKEWVEKLSKAHPEGPWVITAHRHMQLVDAEMEGVDILDIVAAAYNHGFQRGCKYTAKSLTPPAAR